MVAKSKKAGPGKKKIKLLSLKKETVKNLTGAEGKRVKGGVVGIATALCQSAIRKISVESIGGHTYAGISAGNSTIDFGR